MGDYDVVVYDLKISGSLLIDASRNQMSNEILFQMYLTAGSMDLSYSYLLSFIVYSINSYTCSRAVFFHSSCTSHEP